MGQDICLSLLTSLRVDKTQNQSATLAEATDAINERFPTDLALFDLAEDAAAFRWTLKEEHLQSGLPPLLERFYPSFYRDAEQLAECNTVLERLRQDPAAAAWLDLARDKRFVCFQHDRYGHPDWLPLEQSNFRRRMEVRFEAIILASTGKILLETYGGFLRYFGESVQLRFSDLPLAKCLKVYIAG